MVIGDILRRRFLEKGAQWGVPVTDVSHGSLAAFSWTLTGSQIRCAAVGS